jgi:hypothetical protein
MDFFINEIIQIEEVREILIRDPENLKEKAKAIAVKLIKLIYLQLSVADDFVIRQVILLF